jgi:nucleoside-diphosphate-sugar epimerase
MRQSASVLVTGGAGYIGSMLVPLLLQEGYRVRVLDALLYGGEPLLGVWAHPHFEFVRGDVRDESVVEAALHGVDYVVHLAAIVGDPACARDPTLATAINLHASQALIESARARGVRRFVFASTCSNYGRMADDEEAYLDESSALRPVSLYAQTKVDVERLLLAASAPRFCPVVLRFATVYGAAPRLRFDLTVNEFTRALVCEHHLVVYGDQFWRPYVHVRDVARAVTLVLAAPEPSVQAAVFNVGATAENYRKRDIVELVRTHAPDAVIEYVEQPDDPRNYRVSFDKIARELEFTVTRTVPDGIAEVARLLADGVVDHADSPRSRNSSAA